MTRQTMLAVSALSMLAASALASDAETSATAGSSRYQRDGTAQATARYDGVIGFARTQAESGPVSRARGVAVGFDEDGLSLSVSNAVASRFGPAIGATFSLSIDRDGRVSRSAGLSVAEGPLHRSATVAGRTSTGRHGNAAVALASGQTDRFGRVQANTRSEQSRPPRFMKIPHGHRPPRDVRHHRDVRHPRDVRQHRDVRRARVIRF